MILLHACMAYLCLIQGHPYSNDDGEEGIELTPTGTIFWCVIIGVVIGVVLWKNFPPKKRD